jgi:uncharacterized protein YigA (DUF484 family)
MLIEAPAQNENKAHARREKIDVLPKDLPHQPLATVSLDCVAYTPAGDHTHNRRTGCSRFTQVALNNKRPTVDTMTQAADLLKFAMLAETL